MDYPVTCPYCRKVVDSEDSVSDSYAMLAEHIEKSHSNAAQQPETD